MSTPRPRTVRDLEPPFTLAELGRACNVSVAFLRKCIVSGALATFRKGRLIRIAAPEARRFARSCGATPLDPAHDEHLAHAAHRLKLAMAKQASGPYGRDR